jgi:hypothetical protein
MDYSSTFQNSNHDTNFKRPYNTNVFYENIIKKVSTNIKRSLERGEQNQVINFIKNIDPNLLTPSLKNKTIDIMVNTLVNEFKNYKCDLLVDDSHQLMRESIGVSSESGTTHGIYDNPSYSIQRLAEAKMERDVLDRIPELTPRAPEEKSVNSGINNLLGMSTADEVVRILNPKSQYRRNHMLLDSRYRVFIEQSEENISKLQWNYVQKSQSTTNGSVNVIGNVRDIIGFRIYPFRIPYTTNADNKYSRISVFIEELSAQAFIAHEGRKFHFMMTSTIDSEFITLEADVYNGYFWFERPITTLETLTITFGNPLERVVFDRDRDYCSFNYFSSTPFTHITTSKKHNLKSGDRVYITNFDVGIINSVLIDQVFINNKIKSEINDIGGHLITRIDDTTFNIPVDSSQIQNPISNIQANIFYGSKRLFIPIEMIFINPEKK